MYPLLTGVSRCTVFGVNIFFVWWWKSFFHMRLLDWRRYRVYNVLFVTKFRYCVDIIWLFYDVFRFCHFYIYLRLSIELNVIPATGRCRRRQFENNLLLQKWRICFDDIEMINPKGRSESSVSNYSSRVLLASLTSLFDLTFAEPIRWAKVRSKYLLKPKKWSDFAERKSYVQKYGLSTCLEWSLVELWSK